MPDGNMQVRWWRSVTVRLVLASTVASTLMIGVVFGILYWRAVGVVEQQAADTVASEMRGLIEHFSESGLADLMQTVRDRSAVPAEAEPVYLVVDGLGNRLAGNLLAWPPTILPDGGWRKVELYRRGEENPILIGARGYELIGGVRLLVGRALEGRVAIQDAIGESLLWALAALWAMAVGGGILLSRTVLRRVGEVAAINREVMVGELGRRVPVRGSGDEFDRLADSMNAMLSRIEELMVGMRTVTDSVGHDIRSPLTRLRNRLERARLAGASEAEREAALDAAVADVDLTLDLLGRLLDIARAESGLQRGEMAAVDLGAVARDVVDLYEPIAEDRGMVLEADAGREIAIAGHAELLAQALSNLVDNATKYARRRIRVDAWQDENAARVAVTDDGPGIPAGDRERATERFVRLDPSRSGKGAGLGLSLVAAVARLHGGHLELADAQPGLRAVLVLPLPATGRQRGEAIGLGAEGSPKPALRRYEGDPVA
ncbi:MAG: HAMP domain-containing sensor histidine kinase [Thalassobaculum sp.]|uniref:sensor histidine kinase n=1 Tax=Thalassobaculum sp. TaxID=2022740 RepID=UPI0032EDB18A